MKDDQNHFPGHKKRWIRILLSGCNGDSVQTELNLFEDLSSVNICPSKKESRKRETINPATNIIESDQLSLDLFDAELDS